MTSTDTTGTPPVTALLHLIRGAVATHLLGVVGRLGIADLLRDGPRSSEDLAQTVGVEAAVLRRVLRGLTFYRVFDETQDGSFELTELGELLRSDHPDSLLDGAVQVHEIIAPALGQLMHTVRTGEIAFDRVFGHSYFAHFEADPEMGERFDRVMSRVTAVVATGVVAAHDFSAYRKVIDVGGGRGHFLAAILEAHPRIEAALFDLPHVAARAIPYLEARGIRGRCAILGGSFLEEVPPGGDAYLLSWVLHDWDDATCVRILRHCREAMDDAGTLLVIEHVLPERASGAHLSASEILGALIDVDMLALLPGRERTLAEYRRLLLAGGFSLRRTTEIQTAMGQRTIVEAAPVVREPV